MVGQGLNSGARNQIFGITFNFWAVGVLPRHARVPTAAVLAILSHG